MGQGNFQGSPNSGTPSHPYYYLDTTPNSESLEVWERYPTIIGGPWRLDIDLPPFDSRLPRCIGFSSGANPDVNLLDSSEVSTCATMCMLKDVGWKWRRSLLSKINETCKKMAAISQHPFIDDNMCQPFLVQVIFRTWLEALLGGSML